jgi:signal transduction histidine kinase
MKELLKSGDYAPLPVPHTGDEIEELTLTFNTMLTQLQSTLSAQEQFVSHASHQLNTPLAIMRGELEVLMSKARSPEEIQRYHDSLRQELVRLSQLVQDMLMVSRVEAGKAHFRFTTLRLDELVGETLERLAPHPRLKDVRLRYDIDTALVDDETMLEVLGERQLLSVLFENLIENAVKYSPPKGQVTVRLVGGAGQALRAEVIDEGPGMDPQLMNSGARPQRFARGESHGDIQGSGLGLYLAARIAEHHGLTLSVAANSPRGTMIGVEFPPRRPTRGA